MIKVLNETVRRPIVEIESTYSSDVFHIQCTIG